MARFAAGLFAALLIGVAQAQPVAAAAPAGAAAAAADVTAAAEQALANGDTDAAIAGFERAAAMQHAGPIEMGLVRSMLQAGDYRGALAFCAHTAGAHADEPAAGALYAWLLRAGGQDAVARRVLNDSRARAPHDPVTEAAWRAFEGQVLFASGRLLDRPHRMAPQALMQGAQPLPPPGARVVAGGVLLDGGQRALVASAGIEAAGRIWVRNGLGRTTEAVVEPAPPALRAHGVTLLRLLAPLPGGHPDGHPGGHSSSHPSGPAGQAALAPRDPFAGSAGFAIGYPMTVDATPAWPTLREGFFGAFEGREGLRRLGIDVPAGLGGGPVLDAAGRLAGLWLPGGAPAASGGSGAAMVPVSLWRELARQSAGNPGGAGSAPAAGPLPAPRMAVDEAYERGLTIALQVIVLR